MKLNKKALFVWLLFFAWISAIILIDSEKTRAIIIFGPLLLIISLFFLFMVITLFLHTVFDVDPLGIFIKE